jgi:hypothetical protein
MYSTRLDMSNTSYGMTYMMEKRSHCRVTWTKPSSRAKQLIPDYTSAEDVRMTYDVSTASHCWPCEDKEIEHARSGRRCA